MWMICKNQFVMATLVMHVCSDQDMSVCDVFIEIGCAV